jgi:hypothetical protein
MAGFYLGLADGRRVHIAGHEGYTVVDADGTELDWVAYADMPDVVVVYSDIGNDFVDLGEDGMMQTDDARWLERVRAHIGQEWDAESAAFVADYAAPLRPSP